MLVLSRKRGEKILISEGIVITVAEVAGGRIRLAFEAPDHVRILRAELAGRGPPGQATSARPEASKPR
jgi:carbon storage regulator